MTCTFYQTRACTHFKVNPGQIGLECINYGIYGGSGEVAGCVAQSEQKARRLVELAREQKDFLRLAFGSKVGCRTSQAVRS